MKKITNIVKEELENWYPSQPIISQLYEETNGNDLTSNINHFLNKVFYGGVKYADIINSCDLSKGNCSDVTEELYSYLLTLGYDKSRLKIIELRLPKFNLDNAHPEMRDEKNLYHDVLKVDDKYVDLTGSQFGEEFGGVKIFTIDELKTYWNLITTVNEEVNNDPINPGKKIYYHGRSKSRPYTGKYIFITDNLGYASGYSDDNKLYAYSIPFDKNKIFTINNPNHLKLLKKYIDDQTINAIIRDSGQGEEMDWATLSYISTDVFEDPEDLFQHLGFYGVSLKERQGIESIYIFNEKNLKPEGVIDTTQPEIRNQIGQFYKDFQKDKNFLEEDDANGDNLNNTNTITKSPQEIADSLITDPRFKKGTVLTNVDMQLADEAFKRDEGFYIGKDDKGIGNRKERVLQNIQSGELKYAPEASIYLTIDNKPRLSFGDGRHRFAVLRDLGVKSINISIWNGSKKLIPLLQKNNTAVTVNETTYKVYHGTNEKFGKFNFNKTAQGIIWFTDSIDSIKKGEHGGQGNKYVMTRYITINNPAGWDEYEKYGLQQLQDMGYDGVILPQGDKTDYFVFSNKNISAKPVNITEEVDNNDVLYHGSLDDITKFDLNHVKGSNRGLRGWGIYFAATPYKARDYGNVMKIHKNNLNFLETKSEIVTPEFIEAIENKLTTNGDELGSMIKTLYDSFLSRIKKQAGKTVDEARRNILEQYRVDYDKEWSMFFKWLGYDGFNYGDYEYVVFNPDKIEIINDEQLTEDTDYRGQHTAPGTDDSPMHDVTNAFGDDMYGDKALRIFGGYGAYDSYSIWLIQKARNKPNMSVKIYRAVPAILTNQEKINNYEKHKAYILKTGKLPREVTNWRNSSEYYDWLSTEVDRLKLLPPEQDTKVKINTGDWVTINPAYAKQHGISNLDGKFKVLTKTVQAKNLFTDGNSIHEWGYVENV